MERLEEIYPEKWDPFWVLSKIGTKIRQRKIRMKFYFLKI
jgi:hypothetical protein